MCITPIYIDNPHYKNRSPTIQLTKDTHSSKIGVPCGHCPVCLQLRQAYFVQRVQCEAMESDIFSCMLSYNDKYLPTVEINGYKHKYADQRDIQLFLKRLRNNNVFGSPFKAFAVSEFGGKRHRPHWHLLFFIPKPDKPYSLFEQWQREEDLKWKVLDEWYYNLGSKRKPIKDPMLTYKEKNGKRNYDFHYVNPYSSEGMEQDVAFYTSKYLLKHSDYVKKLKGALWHNLSNDDFRYYWNLIKPHTSCSYGFGLGHSDKVLEYLDECVSFSLRNKLPYPVFINPVDGSTFPMSPYLLHKRGLSLSESLAFRQFSDDSFLPDTNVRIIDELSDTERKVCIEQFSRILDKIEKRDISEYTDLDTSTDNSFFEFEYEKNFSRPHFDDLDGSDDF